MYLLWWNVCSVMVLVFGIWMLSRMCELCVCWVMVSEKVCDSGLVVELVKICLV